ncbi:MAG TPA: hypothetical protein VMR70_19715, partial [Flavisolibacter sp.]|nr:hypothetical protein [Flavisolibacter sp.]
ILIFAFSHTTCTSQKAASGNCFKGRLEVKGICSNYTIKLLEGNPGADKIVADWKDETTGKTYTNVFALGSPCSFPANLNVGDEFYFVLDDSKQQCAVCMAYYPKPEKALSIKVLDKPCN